jgi:hypothetical protein
MGLESKNYEAISLSGTMGTDILGNGFSANSVHQIYCLSTGVINISPMGGGNFFWSATTNTTIDVVPSQIIVSGGTFIGFRTKNTGISYTTNAF